MIEADFSCTLHYAGEKLLPSNFCDVYQSGEVLHKLPWDKPCRKGVKIKPVEKLFGIELSSSQHYQKSRLKLMIVGAELVVNHNKLYPTVSCLLHRLQRHQITLLVWPKSAESCLILFCSLSFAYFFSRTPLYTSAPAQAWLGLWETQREHREPRWRSLLGIFKHLEFGRIPVCLRYVTKGSQRTCSACTWSIKHGLGVFWGWWKREVWKPKWK